MFASCLTYMSIIWIGLSTKYAITYERFAVKSISVTCFSKNTSAAEFN